MSKVISPTARAIIDHRKVKSRPIALEELTAVVRARSGAITGRQISLVASILSYVAEAVSLPQALLDWLAGCEVPKEMVGAFFGSAAWGDVLDRAHRAELGERRGLPPLGDRNGPRQSVDPRRDYAVPRIRSVFGINDTEAEVLDLRLLVSERRRSDLRRRAEGVPVAEKARAARSTAAEKAAAKGVSRRTLFRQAERERAAAVAAEVRRAAGEAEVAAGDCCQDPWVQQGISRATWFRRRRKGRETENGTRRDWA